VVSDTARGPGWWQASDGRWYAPELHPDAARFSSAGTDLPNAGAPARPTTSPPGALVSDSAPASEWWQAADGRWIAPSPVSDISDRTEMGLSRSDGGATLAATDRPKASGGAVRNKGLVVLVGAVILSVLVGDGVFLLVRSSRTPTPNTEALVASQAGCGRIVQTGSIVYTFMDQGRIRTTVVHVPPRYADRSPTPLVFVLHGSGSNGPSMEAYTGMDITADSDNFIAVYPTASIPNSGGYDWNVSGDPVPGTASAPDDVLFMVDLLSILEHRYCINSKMVYATGFSRGARMADDLACRASAEFAAVAPSSGVRLPSPCPSTRPVSLLSIHGTADPTDPYNGNGPTFWTYSVPVAMQRWAAHDTCTASPRSTHVAQWTTLTVYPGCPPGVGVELYTIDGADHEWQGGQNGLYDLRGQAIDADSVIWSFFAQHPMG
jgi:polyhydroxybutyrate depolymerase